MRFMFRVTFFWGDFFGRGVTGGVEGGKERKEEGRVAVRNLRVGLNSKLKMENNGKKGT